MNAYQLAGKAIRSAFERQTNQAVYKAGGDASVHAHSARMKAKRTYDDLLLVEPDWANNPGSRAELLRVWQLFADQMTSFALSLRAMGYNRMSFKFAKLGEDALKEATVENNHGFPRGYKRPSVVAGALDRAIPDADLTVGVVGIIGIAAVLFLGAPYIGLLKR